MTEQNTNIEETEEIIELTTEPVVERDVTVTPVTDVTEDPETFPREYVLKLRDENAKARQKAADRDDMAQRLHGALVAATGRLADPDDLTFDDEHLTDAAALMAAIDDLLAKKPHLASRKPSGDVGQGAGSGSDDFNLAGMLRSRA